MKRLVPLVVLATILTGCWSVPKQNGDSKASPKLKEEAKNEADDAVVATMKEPEPTAADVYTFTYAPSAVDSVYPQDYTGLPAAK